MLNAFKKKLAVPLYRLYERRLAGRLNRAQFPRHIGIILDGHRRYARAEGLDTYTDSYRTGMRTFEEVLAWTDEFGIPSITAWVLSTENLSRPAEEIDPYFDVLIELFGRIPNLALRHDFELKVIGSLDLLPPRLVAAAKVAMEEADSGSRRVTIAMGYGGRQEIVDATRDLVDELAGDGVNAADMAERIDAEGIASHLYAPGQPDADLIIRTSGESRMSGFLLWQSAYAEYAFVDVFWPAFRRVDFIRALRDYAAAERRFGK
jgi:short-chain Z-isoprenyl diphosphate synthase